MQGAAVCKSLFTQRAIDTRSRRRERRIHSPLILVPATFGLRGATPLDWIAAVSGVGVGAALTLLFAMRIEVQSPSMP